MNGRVTLLQVGFVASYTIVLIADRITLEGIRGVSFDKWLFQSSWEEDLTLLGLRHPAITDSVRFVDAVLLVLLYSVGAIVARRNEKRQRLAMISLERW